MTADLSEERSTSNITTERLEAETAERLRLEKELLQKEDKVRNLQDISEKLEMELICAKSDMNGYVKHLTNQSEGASVRHQIIIKSRRCSRRKYDSSHVRT